MEPRSLFPDRSRRPLAAFAVLSLAAFLCAACGKEQPAMIVDRIHDLSACIEEAEFGGGSPYPLRTLEGIEPKDNRDGLAYLRAKPGGTITFRRLFTRGRATLSFGCGVAFQGEGVPEESAVGFRVEARKVSSSPDALEERPMETIFDRVFRPSDFPLMTGFLPFELELPGRGDGDWTLRFSCYAVDADSKELSWPGWISPTLVSEGRRVSLDGHPVERLTLKKDLIESFEKKKILQENPDDPVAVGIMDAAEGVLIHGGRRKVLRCAAPSRIRYTLNPLSGSVLSFAVGVDTRKGSALPGGGVNFTVVVEGKTIWNRTLDVRRRPLDQGWKPCTIDMDPWAGRTISLELVTRPQADPTNDIGGWSHPRLLQRKLIPRLAAHEAPTVLLVVVEALRADCLDLYGSSKGLTPRLDAMARNGLLFTKARSVSSWTWPAVGSILTGLYPNSHGVQDRRLCYLVDTIESMPELFAEQGYTTGAFVSNLLISKDNNLHQGFETFVYTPYLTARALNDRFLNWLDNTEGAARFAMLHYFDPHAPYHPPASFHPQTDENGNGPDEGELMEQLAAMEADGTADRALAERYLKILRTAYESEVAYFDTAFGELLDALETRGVLKNCLIVLTADHGEEFFEHGALYHGPHLYEESLHVPLWITGYGKAKCPAKIIQHPVEIKDILPTLCELVGLPLPEAPLPGRSLLDAGSENLFAQTLIGREPGIEGWIEKAALTHDGWKLIFTPESKTVELYNLREDPGELEDLAERESKVREKMLEALKKWQRTTLATAPDSRIFDSEEMESRMKALGYTGK